jgi:hypothetical protein
VQGEAAVRVGVDQLVGGWRNGGENAEPGEGILTVEDSQDAGRDGGARDAVEAIAAGHHVATQITPLTALPIIHDRRSGCEAVHAEGFGVEENLAAGREAGLNQVLDHLLLAVDHDGATAGKVAQGDAVAPAGEAQLDAVVDQALAVHARPGAALAQQIRCSLLEHAGTHTPLDILAVTMLEHDRVHTMPREQVGKGQPGGTGADDGDLGAHGASSWRTGDGEALGTRRSTLHALHGSPC